MFPWFFMFCEVLHRYLGIWSNTLVLQSLLTSFSVSNSFTLFQLLADTPPLEIWTSTKDLSSTGVCLRQYFPGTLSPWSRKVEPIHGFEVYMLITWCTSVQNSSQVPCHDAGSHSSHRHFCPWMDTELLLLRGHDEGASYSALMLVSPSWEIFAYRSQVLIRLP